MIHSETTVVCVYVLFKQIEYVFLQTILWIVPCTQRISLIGTVKKFRDAASCYELYIVIS